MSNWVTLPNGVHIDLDDPNNPITGSGSFGNSNNKFSSMNPSDVRLIYTEYPTRHYELEDSNHNTLGQFKTNEVYKYLKENNISQRMVFQNKIDETQMRGILKVLDSAEKWEKPEFKKEEFKKEEVSKYNKKNSNIFEKNGVDKLSQKFIMETIDDVMDKNQSEYEYDGTVDSDRYEVQFVSHPDGEVELLDVVDRKSQIENYLTKNGIEFEWSKQSNSLYFNYNGKDYRISDHNMPAIVDGVWSYDRNENYSNRIGKTWSDRLEIIKNIIKK